MDNKRRPSIVTDVSQSAVLAAGLTLLLVLGVILYAVLRTAWDIGKSSDAVQVQRLATQTELLISAFGLVFTVLLVLITAYYAWHTRRMANEMRATAERDALDRRRDQAQRMSAWILGGSGKFKVDAPACWEYVTTVTLKNSSQEPIYDVEVVVTSVPIDNTQAFDSHLRLAVVPPDHQQQVSVKLGTAPYRPDIKQPDLTVEQMSVELTFRDSGGRLWRRNREGVLSEPEPIAIVRELKKRWYRRKKRA